ncbi:RNA polymerase sigma factor [Nonlabens ulvanivorans]|uniref:RNA polymerase sigma-70 factor n=1 Tax=Nonlabens ulvanivorans TaxID=906888 RepID=A0A084JU80_NONUL|nr:sigma-70 family RNA polymerase sigma factor [Nonlabens ulvanivorans]KEZ92514.1 RNA polymerase sigma-70 factor [Nonlabens ulvanivorans]PRX15352.1 RNA polymerase sigma-70 factor (ECF subfamily) [Nonlabens ulvanivorans]
MVLKELINECKKHNRKAQKEIYDRFSGNLFASCLKYAPNYEEAQDVLQDTFIVIFNKIDQFKDDGSFEGWCRRIAVNTALQRYRKKKVFNLVNEDQIKDVQDEVEEIEDIDLNSLLNMVQQLPDRYRMVFSMYVLDGYSHKEIASMMEITEGTSKSNLARARQHLKEMINKWRINNNCNAS